MLMFIGKEDAVRDVSEANSKHLNMIQYMGT